MTMKEEISKFESHIIHIYNSRNSKDDDDSRFNLPKGWFDPVPNLEVDDVVAAFPELRGTGRDEDVDVKELLNGFRKNVKDFVKEESVLDVLVWFLSETESSSDFETGLKLLREAIEAGGAYDSVTSISRSFFVQNIDRNQRFLTIIDMMTAYPSFSSIMLDNIAFRRSFWAVACRALEEGKEEGKLLLDRCVRFLSNSKPDVNIIHPILHIVSHLESCKHNKEALELLEAVNKSVSSHPQRRSSISSLLLRKLFGSDICNGQLSNCTANSVLKLLTRLASYSMTASELRAWIVCVLQCRWRVRGGSGKDRLSQTTDPHEMCNQVVRSLLEATRSTLHQCGHVFGTSEVRFESLGSLRIELSAFERRRKQQQPAILRGWPNSSSFTVSLWFRVFDRKDASKRVLYRFINSNDKIVTECSVVENKFKLCVADDIVHFEVNDEESNKSWRHVVVVRGSIREKKSYHSLTRGSHNSHSQIQTRGAKQLFGRTSPSSVTVYIDAKESFKGKLKYPESSNVVKRIWIGTESSKKSSSMWAMGPLYLLKGSLDAIDTLTLYILGPQYRAIFSEKSMSVLRNTRTTKSIWRLKDAGRVLENLVGKSSVVQVKPCVQTNSILLRVACGHDDIVYVTDANEDLRASTQLVSSHVWIPRPWISTMWNSCFGSIPIILAFFEWGASPVRGLDLMQSLELFTQMTCSGVANESMLEVESIYSIVTEILSAKIELENVKLEDRHVNAMFDIALSQVTPSSKYSPLRTKCVDVVVNRAQNGALNIEIDFDNMLRFTGNQAEVQCYDVIESVEDNEVTFKRSAFTSLREVLRSNRKQESFRLKVKRIVDPPPVITNMIAFDSFVLKWNLWRHLPLETQRRRLEMIRVAFSGTHPNAVHNRILLRSTKFVKRMLICITDPVFEISMLPDVLDIVADFVLCGNATKADLETIGGYLVSTLMSIFSSSTRTRQVSPQRQHVEIDDKATQEQVNQLIFLSKPERAFKIRVGLLTMLYKLIIGLPARVFRESHDQNIHGKVIPNPLRDDFNQVFTTTWILTLVLASYEDIETLMSIAGPSSQHDPADNAILALRVLVAVTPIQWKDMSELQRRTFFEMLACAVEKTWHCAQSVRVLTMLIRMLILLFLGVRKDPITSSPLGSSHDSSTTEETEHKICLVRDSHGSFGIIFDAYLNIVNVANEAKDRGLQVGQRVMKANEKTVLDAKSLENILAEVDKVELVVTDPDPDSSCDDLMKSTLDAADMARGVAQPEILSIVMDLLVKIRDDAIARSIGVVESTDESTAKGTRHRARRNLELVVATLQALLALFQIVPNVDRDVWGGPKDNVDSTLVSLKSLICKGATWERKCVYIKTEIISIRQIAQKILSHGVSHYFTKNTNAMDWLETKKSSRSFSLCDTPLSMLVSTTPSLKRSISFPSQQAQFSSKSLRKSLSSNSVKNLTSSMMFRTPSRPPSNSQDNLSPPPPEHHMPEPPSTTVDQLRTPTKEERKTNDEEEGKGQIREHLERIYRKVNSQKIESNVSFLDDTLLKYQGFEDILVNRLTIKYGDKANEELKALRKFVKRSHASGSTPRRQASWATKARLKALSNNSPEESKDAVLEEEMWISESIASIVVDLRDKIAPLVLQSEETDESVSNVFFANVGRLAELSMKHLGSSTSDTAARAYVDKGCFVLWCLGMMVDRRRSLSPSSGGFFRGTSKTSRVIKLTISSLFMMLVDLIDTMETRLDLLRMFLKDIRRVGEAIFQYDESVSLASRIVKSFVPVLAKKEREEDEELTNLRHDVMHMIVTSFRETLQSSEFWNTKDADELSEGLLHFLDRKIGHENFQRWYGSIPASVKSQLETVLDRASDGVGRKRTGSNASGISIISTSSQSATPRRETVKDDDISRLHVTMISKVSNQCTREIESQGNFWNHRLETRNSAWRQWQSQCSILINYLSRSESTDCSTHAENMKKVSNVPLRVEWWVDHFVECPGLTHRKLRSLMMTKESLNRYVPAESKRRPRSRAGTRTNVSRSPSPQKRSKNSRKRVNSSGSSKDRKRENEMLNILNYKLSPMLQTGDVVRRFYNCKRISLATPRKAMLLICDESIYVVDNLQVSPSSEGRLEDTKSDLEDDDEEDTLLASSSFDARHMCRQWKVCDVNFVAKRRQLLRPSALVFGCRPHSISGAYTRHVRESTCLISFESVQERDEVFSRLINLCVNVTKASSLKDVQTQWISGHISNFEYLMALNSFAGRTCKDLSQYPVFPWILSDYESQNLDLSSQSVFRDLSKPMGAMLPDRKEGFHKRYLDLKINFDKERERKKSKRPRTISMADSIVSAFRRSSSQSNLLLLAQEDGLMPPFHYGMSRVTTATLRLPHTHTNQCKTGTHYSSSTIVLHYMVRLQPYAMLHTKLQSGHFDKSDRLFESIRKSWRSASGIDTTKNTQDVKELIPEFFYMPEMFRNVNKFDMGALQNGTVVNDVILPPWAKGSPHEFVRQHRLALESDYVSRNLHKWIDLIFGYKQTGDAAEKAVNVFYYLTYEGAVDLDKIEDDHRRRSIEQQIHEFGQTPKQLFKRPHPVRGMLGSASSRIAYLNRMWIETPASRVCSEDVTTTTTTYDPNTVLSRNLVIHWRRESSSGPVVRVERRGENSSHDSAVVVELGVRCPHLRNVKLTCAFMMEDDSTLITGDTDGTLLLWKVSSLGLELCAPPLCEHNSALHQVVASARFAVAISVSQDGKCVMWDLEQMLAIRTLVAVPSLHRDDFPVVALSDTTGNIWISSDTKLYVLDINGNCLAVSIHENEFSITSILVPSASVGDVIQPVAFTGHEDGSIHVLHVKFDSAKPSPPSRPEKTEKSTEEEELRQVSSLGCSHLPVNDAETVSYCNWSLHRTKRLNGHKSAVISLTMCEDGESFMSWDRDGLGIRWSMDIMEET